MAVESSDVSLAGESRADQRNDQGLHFRAVVHHPGCNPKPQVPNFESKVLNTNPKSSNPKT